MVIPSLINATTYLRLALVGSLEHVINCCRSIFVHQIATYAAEYLYFSLLGKSTCTLVKVHSDFTHCSYLVQLFPEFEQMGTVVPHVYSKFVKLEMFSNS